MLITDPDGEPFWLGQSRRLHDRLRGPKHLVAFTAREATGGHCAPLGPAVRETRIFDWLEQHLRGDAAAS